MIAITIHGRGGQGGVTLAKLIAQAYFLRGEYAQAFGVYAAERSGAPLQAFVRIDHEEITDHNQVRAPDHVIVLDPTLLGPAVATGMKADGWIIVNTPAPPEALATQLAGRRTATVDATAIALARGLGTRTVPIVNTTMLGAVARVLGLTSTDVTAALSAVHFGVTDTEAASEAFKRVAKKQLAGSIPDRSIVRPPAPPASLLDKSIGARPAIRTGSWATRRPERRRLTPPCNHACPAGNDIQSFVSAVGERDFGRALAVLLETSPFPGVCGRVCPAPCMEACNRGTFDESVNIRDLERCVADHARPPDLVTRRPNGLPVAIVGSGPAGLSAAYHLARLGHHTVIFEAGDELGGVLRTGIPAYRLPREVLDREIGHILGLGVVARTSHAISREELLKMTRAFAAVFVATGLQEARSLDLGPTHGGSNDVVLQGIEFLDRVRKGGAAVAGQRVVVVGGGNTAIDAARSARRLGARSVHVVYRRSREEMPAIREEIEAAIEEGIRIDELVSPVRIQVNDSAPSLTCRRMRLGEPDESGRARPIAEETEDAFFDLPCDRVILALGQSADLSVLPEGSDLRRDGTLLGLTGAPVFCGGDFATGDGTVAAAIGNGRMAALHIHRALTGEALLPPERDTVAGPEAIKTYVFAHSGRRRGAEVAPSVRRRSFAEVYAGLARESAALEAKRCFSCGVCNECDRCREYCPEGILFRDDHGYGFDYDYCKGCGICAAQCPRGVILMTQL